MASIEDNLEYFFPKDSPVLIQNPQTTKEKWHNYVHGQLLHDVYNSKSSTAKLQEFYQRRILPSLKVGTFELVGLGVAAVISGEFSGWNEALYRGGYGGLWIANLIAGVLYLCLLCCLSELATAIPVQGGAFAYTRAVYGPVGGFLVGNSENLEYCLFVALNMYTFSDIIIRIFAWTDYQQIIAPFLWLAFSAWAVFMIGYQNKLTWKIMAHSLWFLGAVIFVFCAMSFSQVDPSLAKIRPADIPVMNSDDPLAAPSYQSGQWFSDGAAGIFNALPGSAWWFTGFECITLASKETKNPNSQVPKALWLSWIYLGTCAIFLSIFNVIVAPGAAVIRTSSYPMVDCVLAWYPNATEIGTRAANLIILPATIINMLGMLWCSSRQTFALSRAGYLPLMFSLTEEKHKTPLKASLFVLVYAFLMCAVAEYVPHWESTGINGFSILLNLTIISGIVTYFGIGLVYIGHRMMRNKEKSIPYESPLGTWGGVLLSGIAGTIFIAELGLNQAFRYTFAAFALKMAGSGLYFAYNRFRLVPTEELNIALIHGGSQAESRLLPTSGRSTSTASHLELSTMVSSTGALPNASAAASRAPASRDTHEMRKHGLAWMADDLLDWDLSAQEAAKRRGSKENI